MKAAFFIMLFLFSLSFCFGQSRSELEKKRLQMLREIQETEDILNNIQKDKSESLEMLTLLDKKLNTRNELINNLQKDVSNVDLKITDLNAQISRLSTDITNLKKEYGRVIWLSYLNRQKLNQIMFVFSAVNFNQAYRRLTYLQQYSDYRKRQVKLIISTQSNLNRAIKELDQQKSEKNNLISKTVEETNLLNAEEDNKKNVLVKLKKKEKDLSASINAKNKIADKLKDEIEKLIKREIEERKSKAANHSKNTKTSKTKTVNSSESIRTPDDDIVSSSFKGNRGRLPWPTERGVITNTFGEHSHPVYKTLKIRNSGIDISTTPGSDVRAIFEGEVRCIIPILGANNSVLIRHGNYYTVYTNLIDVKVKAGDKVKTKDVIGKVFTNSSSNSTVLHLEVWDNLTRLDPELWLMKN
jgi:murein hydrolase activator